MGPLREPALSEETPALGASTAGALEEVSMAEAVSTVVAEAGDKLHEVIKR
jgi:hypothetical protein